MTSQTYKNLQIVYKVVSSTRRSAVIETYMVNCLDYSKRGVEIKPKTAGSKIFTFGTLTDALAFHSNGQKVLVCIGINPTAGKRRLTPSVTENAQTLTRFWANALSDMYSYPVPDGTVLCDSLVVIDELDTDVASYNQPTYSFVKKVLSSTGRNVSMVADNFNALKYRFNRWNTPKDNSKVFVYPSEVSSGNIGVAKNAVKAPAWRLGTPTTPVSHKMYWDMYAKNPDSVKTLPGTLRPNDSNAHYCDSLYLLPHFVTIRG